MISHIAKVEISAVSAAMSAKSVSLMERMGEELSEKEAKRLAKGTGFERLRICSSGTTTSDLCFAAAENLFKNQIVKKEEIDALVFVSQTADYDLPATSHILQDRLGLSENIIAMDISQGCSGYVYGLLAGAMLVHSGGCRHVLVCSGDVSENVNPQDRTTAPIFGDGGSASIISAGAGNFSFHFTTIGKEHAAIVIPNSASRKSGNGEKGFVQLDGMKIMDFSLSRVPDNIEQLLAEVKMKNQEIGLYACHQANKLILNTLADRLQVERDKVPFAAGEIGNTSSASIPLLFTEQYAEKLNPSLAKTILCGFGVGLSIGTLITDLSKTRILRTVEL